MPKTRKDPSEQEIKNAIIDFLSYQKDLIVIPHDSVGIYDPTKGIFRKRSRGNFKNVWYTGVSDILVYGPEFGFWAIEVKSAKGVVRPDQKLFLEAVAGMKGYASVVRSVDHVEGTLKVIRTLRNHPRHQTDALN